MRAVVKRHRWHGASYLKEYGILKNNGLRSIVFLCVLEQQENITLELKIPFISVRARVNYTEEDRK